VRQSILSLSSLEQRRGVAILRIRIMRVNPDISSYFGFPVS
jgi:hypothetical protein